MKIKSEPTQVKSKGLGVLDFFDEKFIGLLEKHFPTLSFEHFCIRILDKDMKKTQERLSIAHTKLEDYKNNEVIIDADTPDSLTSLLKVVEEYMKDKGL